MILVVGCGYVGERVADLLQTQGLEVTGVTHSAESAARLSRTKRYPVLACDVSDAASVQAMARALAAGPVAILHCASSNRGGAEMYKKVFVEGCGHLSRHFPETPILFTSSSSVYPQTDGSLVTEESDATPERTTSLHLRAAEQVVISSGGCVARLAGIYGPGRSFVLKNFLLGTATIEGNHGDGRFLNQIHRDDAASALVHLVATGRKGVFNVVDDVPMTQRDCFAGLARRFDRPMPPTTEPDTGRKRAWTHKRISNAKLRASGWTPRFPSYFDALDNDRELVPSILAQLDDA
jgi:nucleoside-diphosphate-sugar epimerase